MRKLADVAAELYGLPLEKFTSTRDRIAKELRSKGAKDLAQQVRKLRKPATAAWAVNLLVRRAGDEVEQLLSLGASLREAQERLDPEALRALDEQRRGVVAAVTRRARELAEESGQPISRSVTDQVDSTLRAALADARAAEAVSSGQLSQPLSSAGLGSADTSGAVAAPVVPRGGGRAASPNSAARRRREGSGRDAARRRLETAERKVEEAQERARAEQSEADEALARLRAATSRQEELAARRAELEAELRTLRQQASRVERDVRTAEKRHESSRRAARKTEAALARAREDLDRLRS